MPVKLAEYEPPKAYEPKNQDTILSIKHSIIEPKLDGVRGIIHCTSDGVYILSRRKGKSGKYSQFQDNVPHLRDHPILIALGKEGYTILDCEILAPVDDDTLGKTMSIIGALPAKAIATQKEIGNAYAMLFDIVYHKGKDLREISWRSRRAYLTNIPLHDYLRHTPYIESKDIEERRRLAKQYIDQGYEGIVLKNPEATYFGSRAWLKHKERDTIDAQVSGWTEGKGKYAGTIGALEVSVIDKNTKELRFMCTVAPGTDAKRNELYARLKDLTKDQIVNLNIIVELEGQQITKEKSMRHPRILRYREDRSEPNEL